jgi:hypothetical protein
VSAPIAGLHSWAPNMYWSHTRQFILAVKNMRRLSIYHLAHTYAELIFHVVDKMRSRIVNDTWRVCPWLPEPRWPCWDGCQSSRQGFPSASQQTSWSPNVHESLITQKIYTFEQDCESRSASGSGLDPDSMTLWIRIRIGNPDRSRGKKMKKNKYFFS